MTENDQPRPDLDAAVDAMLPWLTAVSDDAAAASLRRTRIALAAGRERLRGGSPASRWRWALPAAVTLVAGAIAAFAFWPKAPAGGGPQVVVKTVAPASAAAPLSPAASPVAPSVSAPGQVVRRRLARASRVAAATRLDDALRAQPDPVLALARALEAIPETAWNEAMAKTSAPIGAAELSVAPIVVPPLVTPPITDPPAPPVQGEP